jgi:hypothetical protein
MRDAILSRSIPEPTSGCWLWLGIANAKNGYGYAPLGRRGCTRLSHRLSYEVFVGPIPPGLHIDHRCSTKLCVNPDHLEAVTQQVNNQRQRHSNQFRSVTACVNGHPFDADNTYLRPTGGRACKTCIAQRSAAWSANNRSRRAAHTRAYRARRKAD